MRTILTLLATLALVAVASDSQAFAASPQHDSVQSGQISDAQLAALGLGGMQRVTDIEGQQVRGRFLGRHIQITFTQVNRGRTVTNIFLSSPFQLFSLLK